MKTLRILSVVLMIPLLLAADIPGKPTKDPTDKRMLELEARESALRVLEEDVGKKIEHLKLLREAAIAAIIPQERERTEKLKTLINFYAAMKPKNAAKLLEQLPTKLSAKVLGAMKSRSAGKILNVMNPQRAVQISKLMAGRN